MRMRLNITKTAQENASAYYEAAKEARGRMKGAEKAAEETRKEIEEAEKEKARKKRAGETKIARKKEWYEKFHYFFTSGGRLLIGGRSADQNDLVYKAHFEDGDLFLHADIQGGSACILKQGEAAGEAELREAAQFAACFSNAWKNGNAAVDVYAVKRSQVSKHAHGGFIGRGAFAIEGERTWFRETALKLKIGLAAGIAAVLPGLCARKLEKEALLVPGKHEKGKIVGKVSKMLGVHPDEVQNLLPAGRAAIIK